MSKSTANLRVFRTPATARRRPGCRPNASAGNSSVTTSKTARREGPVVGRNCYIGSVAAGGNQASANPAAVVAGVERVPAAAQPNLEPGAEVHRVGHRRHADVTKVAGAVARGDRDASGGVRRLIFSFGSDVDLDCEAIEIGGRSIIAARKRNDLSWITGHRNPD